MWPDEQSEARRPSNDAKPTTDLPRSVYSGNRYNEVLFPADEGLAQAARLDIRREGNGLLSFNINGSPGEDIILSTRNKVQVRPSLDKVRRRLLVAL